MKNPFGRTLAFLQLWILLLWEGVGGLYFGWSPLAIFLVWGAGFWTLNIATASVLHTLIKLTQPEAVVTGDIEEDDIG